MTRAPLDFSIGPHTLRNITVLTLPLLHRPWNNPVALLLSPLAGALAAGCCALLKPSELAPASSVLLGALVPSYLDPAAVAVVQGGADETVHALALRWDHIFFTGGTRVGRAVAAAAAVRLTPLTLELGGKSAVVVADDLDDAEIAIAARRVWHGKLMNAGQVCVSPDYVLVTRVKVDKFVEGVVKANMEFFAGNEQDRTDQVGDIVSAAHCRRICDMLSRSKGRVIIGGEVLSEKRIAPTVVTDVGEDDALMEE